MAGFHFFFGRLSWPRGSRLDLWHRSRALPLHEQDVLLQRGELCMRNRSHYDETMPANSLAKYHLQGEKQRVFKSLVGGSGGAGSPMSCWGFTYWVRI